jgi:hypothetical protein
MASQLFMYIFKDSIEAYRGEISTLSKCFPLKYVLRHIHANNMSKSNGIYFCEVCNCLVPLGQLLGQGLKIQFAEPPNVNCWSIRKLSLKCFRFTLWYLPSGNQVFKNI